MSKMNKNNKVLNYEETIININKKRELLYNNNEVPQNLIDYNDQIVIYTNLNLDKNNEEIYNNKLLININKYNFNLDQIQDYMTKNNIDIAKVMIILNRNEVTMVKLLKNSYIRNMIKQSSYSWFCGDDDKSMECHKKSTKKLI